MDPFFEVRKVSLGKNVTYQVRGYLPHGDLSPQVIECPEPLKLSSAVWVVQEKLTVHVNWSRKVEDGMLVMESRNSLRYEIPVTAPSGWQNILYVYTTNWAAPEPFPKRFYFTLDFDR